MEKRVLFVVNPEAGRGEIRSRLLEVVQILTKAGCTVTVHPTSAPGEILKLLTSCAEQYDMVLASGGDGTLNETVSGLMALQKRPMLAYIPSGTVNDTATNLQIPRNIRKAAEIAVNGIEFPCDVASFNERWFLYVAAFGLFSDVAYGTSQLQKNTLGRLAYLLQGVRALSDVKTYHVRLTTPTGVIEDDVIFGMVCSTTSLGGFSPMKPALRELISLNDGLSEVLLVKRPNSLTDLSNMAAAILRLDLGAKYFHFVQTTSAVLEFSKPTAWTLDGEYGGEVTWVEIKNHPSALRFCAPRGEEDMKE